MRFLADSLMSRVLALDCKALKVLLVLAFLLPARCDFSPYSNHPSLLLSTTCRNSTLTYHLPHPPPLTSSSATSTSEVIVLTDSAILCLSGNQGDVKEFGNIIRSCTSLKLSVSVDVDIATISKLVSKEVRFSLGFAMVILHFLPTCFAFLLHFLGCFLAAQLGRRSFAFNPSCPNSSRPAPPRLAVSALPQAIFPLLHSRGLDGGGGQCGNWLG